MNRSSSPSSASRAYEPSRSAEPANPDRPTSYGRHRASWRYAGAHEGRVRPVYVRPGPILVLAVGLVLLAMPVVMWSDRPGDIDTPVDTVGPAAEGDETGLGLIDPTSTTARPTVTPTVTPTGATPTPTATASATPTPTPTPTSTPTASPSPTAVPTPTATPAPRESSAPPPPPPAPVLLGPGGASGLASMVERYCDRYVSGSSSAEPRSDGRWECERWLSSSRIVNMDVACADTYGAGAYARQTGYDAWGWRCYRDEG